MRQLPTRWVIFQVLAILRLTWTYFRADLSETVPSTSWPAFRSCFQLSSASPENPLVCPFSLPMMSRGFRSCTRIPRDIIGSENGQTSGFSGLAELNWKHERKAGQLVDGTVSDKSALK